MPDDFFDDLNDLTSGVEPERVADSATSVEAGLQKLASLVEDLNRDLSTSTILDRAMDAVLELTGAERGFLVLLSERGEWDFRVARNMESRDIADAENAASHTVIRKVLDGRRPILINDVVGASDLTKQQSIARMQVRSIMGAPVISKGKLLGAAYVDTSRLAGVFDQTSLVLFDTFVQLTAVALETAHLIEAEQQATARYRELQEYLDTILDSQPQGVVILDGRLKIEYASAQSSALLDGAVLTRGTPLADSRCCNSASMLHILKDLQDFLLQKEGRRSFFDLGARTLAYSFFHLYRAPGGERVGIILEDVTLQKQLEHKLIESEKQSTINQLAGGIAHEINNSLQPVKGRIELLTMRLKKAGVPLDNGVDKDLETISALSERIEKIARDLRHLTRPTASNFSPVNLTALIRSTVEMMESTTGTLRGFSIANPAAPFRLELDIEENLPPVLGDAHSVESAIINMILNSAHALRARGEGTLTVAARAAEGNVVEVAVSDTGGGIHPDVLPRVFEPYFTTRTDAGGTGLGMCIIQNVAESHSAKLDLKSQWGVGTQVTLTFPAMKSSPATAG